MRKILQLAVVLLLAATGAWAQGVTTASISGKVTGAKGAVSAERKTTDSEALPGASIVATHMPSGTTYGTISLADGRFSIPAMRIGGPYTVKVSFVGYQEQTFNEIYLSLGTATNINVTLTESATELETIVVSASRNDVFSSDRTGAATNITKDALATLPTLSRSINDFTRLTPQASGRSFVGSDARFNNITIDGSILNNSFGLADQPGGRTGSTPISLDAIEEIQVNIAPYDVRQAGFTGAGINAVTRSGTNDFSGSVFLNQRNESFVGTKAKDKDVLTQAFNVSQYGFRLGGPILKNKLFFFVNGELERRSEPATQFVANDGTQPVTGNVTRVLRSDLDEVSNILRTRYNYETGPYEGYDNETRSDKFLIKLDYNINKNHRFSLRYNWLDSQTDVLTSNSNSLGFGDRRTNNNALNFQNSNYIQFEKINSVIGELNSTFGGKFANQIIAGYTSQVEDRGSRGNFFPLIEIQNNSTTYITAGFEPFTPSNKLNYQTIQFQENFTYFAGKHTITAGFNIENFKFENVFFPGSQSVYVYNSMADFRNATDTNPANDPILRRFQLRYVNPNLIAPGADPVQPTEVLYAGAYLQDEFEVIPGLKVTAGIRADLPNFADTGFDNPIVSTLSFLDREGNPYSINTAELPGSKLLISPRLGFNYDVFGDRTLQVRGGTGLFTGRPVFVWISNQIGNNGVLTGFQELNNTTTRPFDPNPLAYVPPTATLPTSVEIAATDRDFKFPQIWRSNIAVDKKLPYGLVGTLEFIYSQDVNGIGYFNANLPAAQTAFVGADNRPRWTSNRLNAPPAVPTYTITSAEVLTNVKGGTSSATSIKIEKLPSKGFYGLAAYNFGVAKNFIDPGSIARGSWTNNPIALNPNNPALAFGNNDQRHRAIALVGYRKEYADRFATSVSLFWEGRNQGRFSYIHSNDANGDGANNDLIYIPRDQSEMIFQDYDPDGTGPAGIYTAAQQAADWEAYINQDEYLSANRGKYAERNGALLPWVNRADFSFIQEFFINAGGKRNTLQLRADIINVGNLINSDWGVGDNIVRRNPLNRAAFTAAGEPIYRLNNNGVVSGQVVPITETFTSSAGLGDVWQMQLGIRYIFN
jgi:hypothetical protein